MRAIAEPDIQLRIERDNSWWRAEGADVPEAAYPRRVYFEPFKSLALNFEVRRAMVLLGPRRVGKTVMIKQLISDAIGSGLSSRSILYASIDAPIYSGMPLERFLQFLPTDASPPCLVFFDEIQYLKDWEVHLKDLVDSYPHIKFVATGSAAAALRLKSREFGAGRFSEFMLPPLTFYEFLCFIEQDEDLIEVHRHRRRSYSTHDINSLNDRFVDYLNFGGYPEAVLNPDQCEQILINLSGTTSSIRFY